MAASRTFPLRVLATVFMVACGSRTLTSAGDAVDDFTRTWNQRPVVVRSVLYTVVYDEVGRVGIHYRGKQAGLTVATPSSHYYEFDSPGSDDNIVETTPNDVFSEMSTRFNRAYHLDIGTVKTITPLLLRQFEPGVTLVVDSVKLERNRVRLEFRRTDKEGGFATSLIVAWPTPFSKAFGEREPVERVIHRFVSPL